MPRVEEVSLYRLRVRLGQAFRIAYASSSYAETLVVAVRGGGVTGWGEAAPAPRVTCENQGSVEAYVEAVARRILGADPLDGLGRLLQTVHAAGGCFSAARAALEAALLDLAAKQLGVPASELLGGRLHGCLETDYTVGLPPRESVVDIAARRGRAWEAFAEAVEYITGLRGTPPSDAPVPLPGINGFRKLKVKTGLGDPELDAALVEAVDEAARGRAVIRVDANQAWTLKQSIRVVRRLERSLAGRLELVEQPLPAERVEDARTLRGLVETPLVLDESARTLHEVARIAALRAADAVNIKIAKIGGPLQAAKAAAILEAHGLEAMWGCMVETMLGIAQAWHPAASSPATRYVDLDSPLFLTENPIDATLAYEKRGDTVCITARPGTKGLGAVPHTEKLEQLAMYTA